MSAPWNPPRRRRNRAPRRKCRAGCAFTAVGEDCAAAATRLGTLRERYLDVVTANEKILHDGRAKELRVALAPYEEQFDAAAKAIVKSPTLAACSQDAAFARAFDELVGAPP